jgi:hypothetical protein
MPQLTFPFAETIILSQKIGSHYPILFEVAYAIKTKYVCLVDDDNRFRNNHIEVLLKVLKMGYPFVATQRVFVDEQGAELGLENPLSSQVDSNNMAMETQLLREAADFWAGWCHGDRAFTDRSLTAFLCARNIPCMRVRGAYTVRYKVRPDWDLPHVEDGKTIFEDLVGNRFLISEVK